jgi:hypothetical protein
VKIASQRLPSSPHPVLCALRARRGEIIAFLESRTYKSLLPACPPTSTFILCIFKHLQIPFPPTPFFPHRYKTPGCARSLHSVLRTHCPQRFCYQRVAASYSLLALFFVLLPFIFNCLQPLFQKHRGWGYAKRVGQPFSGCPPATSSMDNYEGQGGRTMTSKPTPLHQAPLAVPYLQLRTSIAASPKWSIIPPPELPARLRGRSV